MISIVRRSYSDDTDDRYGQLNEANLFNSSGFAALWRSVGGRPVCFDAESEGQVVAALPGVEFGRWPLVRFQAMPDGLYANIRYADSLPIDKATIARNLLTSISGRGYLSAHIYDYHNHMNAADCCAAKQCETMIVDISNPDWQPPDKKLLSEIRKAERESINVVPFDAGLHMAAFMTLAAQAELSHGRQHAKYSLEFFHRLAKLARRDSRIQWLWCEHDGKAVSSHIYFVEGTQLLNWQVYYDRAGSFLKANQYMLYTTAQEFARKGIETLNLGASPANATRLKSYKEKYGGHAFQYWSFHYCSALGKLVGALRR